MDIEEQFTESVKRLRESDYQYQMLIYWYYMVCTNSLHLEIIIWKELML